ncbi:unnamed protein product [Bursaphelenchus xylophilus]|uniref:(pine wood nematode) hypothetical protein n=1 Tax=Bursaphelenchus xylophilus TaxID=6326 RepID=A0A1I7RVW6_BURXY|nr:unnamed protein product [Bursaphelenchus xylophilus]CAG9094795.1 unnamed protein product [Bursaphelenchus xylophilus]
MIFFPNNHVYKVNDVDNNHAAYRWDPFRTWGLVEKPLAQCGGARKSDAAGIPLRKDETASTILHTSAGC